MLKEQVAEWLYKWYQGGANWIDLPENVKERYRVDAKGLINLFKAEVDKLTVIDGKDRQRVYKEAPEDACEEIDWLLIEAQLQHTKKQLLDLMGE